MPTIAEATRPLDTAKLKQLLPSVIVIPSVAGGFPPTPPSPNPFLRTTLPPQMSLQPDVLRQFYNPAVKQFRLFPLTPQSNPGFGANVQSQLRPLQKQITTLQQQQAATTPDTQLF